MTFMRISFSTDGVRQERDLARPLDRVRELPLVGGAVSADAARDDLSLFGQAPLQAREVLVIDVRVLLDAELADFFAEALGTLLVLLLVTLLFVPEKRHPIPPLIRT